MTVETHVVTATIDPDGINLSAPIEAGTLTMDSGWVPYHQGQITVPMSIGDLSPYLPGVLPVRIDASVVGNPDATEQWNLHARHIREDHLAGTYTIDVASAEALVQDWGADTITTAFAAGRSLTLICQDILRRILDNPTLTVSADTGGLQIDDNLRVWTAGTPAWDYLAQICKSVGGRTLSPAPFGGWQIRAEIPIDGSPITIPAPDAALSYVREWTRDGDDVANAVAVEYTGGDPTYTTVAVPGSSPAVSVQVEDRRYGRGFVPTSAITKPALVKALDTTTTASRATPQATRDAYARTVRRRRASLGYTVSFRTLSHYGVRPRSVIIDPPMYIGRVSHDFGTNEMTVSANPPYPEDPV